MSNITDTEMSGIVLCNVLTNERYANKVLPELSIDFFTDETEKSILKTLMSLYIKYSKVPSTKELVATMKECTNVHGLDKNIITDVLGDSLVIQNQDWLIDQTERFIKRRRTMIAFEQTFSDYEGGDVDVDSFYKQFQDAAAFSFNDSIGHSLVQDSHLRWELYTKKENKYPFYIKMLDLITQGGMEAGTLNCVLAGTNAGKSLFMGDIAAKTALNGGTVLVISLEMAEIKLTERIECNLMDVPINELRKMERVDFLHKQSKYLEQIQLKGGDIIFKQFPTKQAHAGHFKNLLTECKNKLGYDFDLVVIDYLNICDRVRGSKNTTSYEEVKGIAEELRALAIEFNLPILTATQTNRDGQNATDLSLSNVSESHGLSATVDFFIALIGTEEWDEQKKIQIKQLKSRYGDVSYYTKFYVGRDKKYMRMFDLADNAQNTVPENKISTDKFSGKSNNKEITKVDVNTFDLSSLG